MLELSDIEQILTNGWINVNVVNLSRLVDAGTTVTVVLSDGEFEVPSTIGDALVTASKQHTFTKQALIKMRVLTREV